MNGRYDARLGILLLGALTLLAPLRADAPLPEPADERELTPLVVMIRARLAGKVPSIGAGLIFGLRSDRLYIVTVNHLVRDIGLGAGEVSSAEDIEVDLHWLPGEPQRAILLPDFDQSLDLAVLMVPGARKLAVPRLRWASLVKPDTLAPGARVVPLGYPDGMRWFVPRQPHVISSVGSQIIKTEGSLANGHSGGTLTTEDWRIAGIVRAGGSLLAEASRIDVVMQRLTDWGYQPEVTFREAPTSSRAKANPDPAATLERDRQAAEALVSRWIVAETTRDARTLAVGLAAMPFYNKGYMVTRREDLEAFYARPVTRTVPTEEIQSIRATTIRELGANGSDVRNIVARSSGPNVLRSLSMSDNDWIGVVTFNRPGAADRAFFVRSIDGRMKVAGFTSITRGALSTKRPQ